MNVVPLQMAVAVCQVMGLVIGINYPVTGIWIPALSLVVL